MREREFWNFADCVWQGADGSGSGSGSAGQRLATCCQNGGQEAEGVCCGEKSQRCHHVSGAHRLCCSSWEGGCWYIWKVKVGILTMHPCGKCGTGVKGQFNIFKSDFWPDSYLHRLENWRFEEWGDQVTVVSCDMRDWAAPEKADIIVSELLGSFGDNELSPECLDGAQHFLKGSELLSQRAILHTLQLLVFALNCCLCFFFTSFHFLSLLFILVQRTEWASLVPTRPTWPRCPPPSSTTKCAAAGNETRTPSATLRRRMWCVCTTSTSWPNLKPASPSNTQRPVGETPGLWEWVVFLFFVF